jgi:hypothetical protein
MMPAASSRSRRGWIAALNTVVVGGLGYLVLGTSRELAVLVLVAAMLGILLERAELS